ncbi:hypothetical protein Bca4012_080111 [Brassica carinata]
MSLNLFVTYVCKVWQLLADQSIASSSRYPLQEALLPSCLPLGAKTERHGGTIHIRGVLTLCSGGSCGKWTEPLSLRKPTEKP